MSRLGLPKFRFFLLTFLFILFFWVFYFELGLLTSRRESIRGFSQEPLRIVLFSDLHAGSFRITESYIETLVDRVNSENPDIVLIAGDFAINGVIGGRSIPIEKVSQILARLKPKYGKFAVLGNHDWWNDGPKIRESLERNGIVVLENQLKKIVYGTHSAIQLIGIGDDYTGHADENLALKAFERNLPRIVLTHDPSAFLDLKMEFDFGFAGHTHGGQVNLPILGALIVPGRAPRSWARGWSKDQAGRKLFVTQGIGTSILPVRFNAPPEYVVFDFMP